MKLTGNKTLWLLLACVLAAWHFGLFAGVHPSRQPDRPQPPAPSPKAVRLAKVREQISQLEKRLAETDRKLLATRQDRAQALKRLGEQCHNAGITPGSLDKPGPMVIADYQLRVLTRLIAKQDDGIEQLLQEQAGQRAELEIQRANEVRVQEDLPPESLNETADARQTKILREDLARQGKPEPRPVNQALSATKPAPALGTPTPTPLSASHPDGNKTRQQPAIAGQVLSRPLTIVPSPPAPRRLTKVPSAPRRPASLAPHPPEAWVARADQAGSPRRPRQSEVRIAPASAGKKAARSAQAHATRSRYGAPCPASPPRRFPRLITPPRYGAQTNHELRVWPGSGCRPVAPPRRLPAPAPEIHVYRIYYVPAPERIYYQQPYVAPHFVVWPSRPY